MTQATGPVSPVEPLESRHPIDPRDLRNALGCFGTGVAVITARAGEGRRAGLTVNSFASVSLDPPLVLWSLVAHSPSLSVFQEASHFTVNVLARSQQHLALHFARPSDDKFAAVGWTEGRGGAPVLDHVVAHFQCRNANRYYGGDHVIFLGAVESYNYTGEEALHFSRGKFGRFTPHE
ncbi:MAG: flavin reductase family protein [Hyphomicrobiales bacterium]|nr:flavin reductase family protein [Hyphomicrobiales bacterium]